MNILRAIERILFERKPKTLPELLDELENYWLKKSPESLSAHQCHDLANHTREIWGQLHHAFLWAAPENYDMFNKAADLFEQAKVMLQKAPIQNYTLQQAAAIPNLIENNVGLRIQKLRIIADTSLSTYEKTERLQAINGERIQIFRTGQAVVR